MSVNWQCFLHYDVDGFFFCKEGHYLLFLTDSGFLIIFYDCKLTMFFTVFNVFF